MLTESQVAIGFSVISLLGQAVNAWLKVKMRGDLLEMQLGLLEKMDRTYVRKEVCEVLHPGFRIGR